MTPYGKVIKGKVTEGKVIEGKERLISEGSIFEFDDYIEVRKIIAIPQLVHRSNTAFIHQGDITALFPLLFPSDSHLKIYF
jgi:hypothetical protein